MTKAERRAAQSGAAKAQAAAKQREAYLESLSHRRKLAHAECHIRKLEALLSDWDSDGHRIFEQTNSEGEHQLCCEMLKPLSDELGLVVGDALQALRNTLDNLAFALAKTHTPGLTPEQEEEVSFPIPRRQTPIALGHPAIALMSQGAQNDLCALTPNPARNQLDQHPLWLLNKTANRDKHREIPTAAVAFAVQEMKIGIAGESGYIDYLQMKGNQLLQMGANPSIVAVWGRGSTLKPHIRSGVNVIFDKGIEVENRLVGQTLRLFHDYIRDTVVKSLEVHL